ncbi:hypothetical protein [Streptomyces griseocarneus]|nr:hypothetical protein [Streptomyces griseocarneus]
MDGTLVPTWGRSVAVPSKNHGYSASMQAPIKADAKLALADGG